MELAKWWADWQHTQHARSFDFRARLPGRTLIREYESFNDVLLLKEQIERGSSEIVEVGCATGEFFRYLQLRHRGVRYRGYDVSRPAIERAREKYPDGSFSIVDPDLSVLVDAIRKAAVPQVVYSKDVMHHQVKPLDFLSALIRIPTHAVVLRCRTRDTGKTEWDPDQSCQYHYNGWMPYIVINTDELIEFVRSVAPAAEIIVMKNPMVLGGLHNRYLPKECYLTQTGTAETAIAILLHSSPSGRIRMENRPDATPRYTVLDRLLLGIKARLQ